MRGNKEKDYMLVENGIRWREGLIRLDARREAKDEEIGFGKDVGDLRRRPR